jgi:hypothetical protein
MYNNLQINTLQTNRNTIAIRICYLKKVKRKRVKLSQQQAVDATGFCNTKTPKLYT